MSCASCHNDGGSDGRVWDITGFGEGLRNTISLKGRSGVGHGFLHWSANFDEVQDFEKQIRDLAGGLGLMTDAQFNAGTRNQALGDKKAGISTDLDLLATYVSSLNSFDESPFNNQDGTLTSAAVAGKQVFESKNCISCHASPKYTNSLDGSTLSNIGTIKPASGKRLNAILSGIDVPTLKDVWQTAPYLHDGSANTLEDAFNAHQGVVLDSVEIQSLVRFIQEINGDAVSQTPNTPPTVTLTSPTNNATVVQGNTITLSANASDDGSITKVDFFDGTTLIGSDNTAPYSLPWATSTATTTGVHSLTAVAVDNLGAQSTSNESLVNVNQAAATPVLLSQNKTATQSSTITFGGVTALASFALDGNTNGAFFGLSLSHTNGQTEVQPWWQVDLAQSASISQVRIYNRTDCCSERLANFYVFVSPTDMTGKTLAQLVADTTVTKQLVASFNGANNITLNFANPQARYVRIQLVGTNSLEMAEVQVFGAFGTPPANTAPTVALTAPSNNAAVVQGNSITMSANATDDGSIARVDFFDGTTLVESDTTAPYSVTWATSTTTATGVHSLTAVAIDNLGLQSTSQPTSVTVNATPANTAPTVALTAPSNNAAVVQGNSITMSANASDDGSIARVDFFDGTTLVESDTTAPYSVTWATSTTTATGVHSLTAVAIDNLGLQSTSQPTSVTVNATPANTAPTVALTAPSNNAAVVQGNSITLSANASDDGSIAKVDFFDGTTLIGSDTTAPYSLPWATSTATTTGVHSLTAVATDNLGLQSTSAAISVTVNTTTSNPSPVLLSQNKVASQSSTRSVFGVTALPSFAVDGSTNGAFLSQSLSHTNSEPQPWWQVDLAQSASISQVRIYNRTDCCSARLANFYVFVSPTDMTGKTLAQLVADTTVTKQLVASFNGANNITLNFANPQARYVRIQLVGTNSLEMAEVQVFGAFGTPPANTAPTVALTAPSNNAAVVQGNSITMSANATDDGSIARVDFFDGTTLVESDTTAPYSVTWATSTTTATGVHSLTAVAIDNLGLQSTSQPTSVTVNATPANTAPTVALTAPSNNAAVVQGNSITLSANASDDGSIAKVDFFDGTTLIGSDTTAPYSLPWATSTATTTGVHSLTAVATDNLGLQSTSAAISVTVNTTTSNPSPVLLSQNKVASQSSTRSVFGVTALPSFAVDGSTNGAFLSQSLSHTNSEPQPWWQVDLAQSASISQVRIYNRTDCCSARLANFYVFVSPTDMTGKTLAQLVADTTVTKQLVASFNGANNITLNFANPQARYVRIQLVGTNSLEMAEVQVFGAFNN